MRRMILKWWMTLMMALLLTVLCGTSLAEGMDMVLLIDQSRSMYRENWSGNRLTITGNDQNNLRMDAGSVLVSLLDMQDARAGVVLYHQSLPIGVDSLRNPYTSRLVTVSGGSWNARRNLSEMLIMAQHSTSGGSDLGEAMLEAQDMLQGSGTDRRRVIVLLNDGGFDVSETSGDRRTEAKSRQEFESVVSWAQRNGTSIHFVALRGTETVPASEQSLFRQAAESTGGSYWPVGSAADLVKTYVDIFAAEHDARVVSSAATKSSGRYTARISVPNGAVTEINIVVPRSEKDMDVTLRRPDGTAVTEDGRNIFRFDLPHCTVFKLTGTARMQGDWTVSFAISEVLGSEVLTVLNYAMAPEVRLNGETGGLTLGKDQTVKVRVTMQENGAPITNTALYRSGGIQAELTIRNATGLVIGSPIPLAAQADHFSGQIDLPRVNAGNPLQAGTYSVSVTLTGDGLNKRVTDIPLRLTNAAPQQTTAVTVLSALRIHDPLVKTENDFTREHSFDIDLTQHVTDPDGDPLTFVLDNVPDGIRANLMGSTLHVSTANTDSQGEIALTVHDNDGGRLDMRIPVQVTNVRKQMASSYHLTATVTQGHVAKNGDVTVMATLMQDGRKVTEEAIFGLTSIQATCSGFSPVTLTRVANTATFTAQLPAGTKAITQSWTITGAIRGIMLKTETVSFTVDNAAPVWNPGSRAADMGLASLRVCDPLNEPYEAMLRRTVPLNQFFTDPDGDALTYTVTDVPDGITARVETQDLIVLNSGADVQGEIYLTVTDADGYAPKQLHITIPVKVMNVSRTLAEHYSVRLLPPEQRVGKNQEVVITAEMRYDGGPVPDAAEHARILERLTLQVVMNGGSPLPFTADLGTNTLHMVCRTGAIDCAYTFAGTAYMGSTELPVEGMEFHVGNVTPWLDEAAFSALPDTARVDPFLFMKADDRAQVLELSALLKDTADDRLVFRAYVAYEGLWELHEERTDEQWLNWCQDREGLAVSASGRLELDCRVPGGDVMPFGTRTLLLTGTDGDGKTVVATYTQRVISQRNMLCWAAAIGLLILLLVAYRIWCLVHRPWSLGYGRLERICGKAYLQDKLFPTTAPMFKKRGKLPLDRMVCVEDCFLWDKDELVNTSVEPVYRAMCDLTEQTTLSPRRGKKLRVHFKGLPKDMTLDVSMDGKQLDLKKPAIWEPQGTMKIRCGVLELTLHRIPQDAPKTK